jgi:hypothetical protein
MKSIYSMLIFVFFSFLGFSQEIPKTEDSLVVVTTLDGAVRIGYVLSDDGRELLFYNKEIGKLYIRKENIKSIVPYVSQDFKVVDGEYRNSGPFTTRYFFTTNSLPIKKKENYAMINLHGPEVHIAVTDRFSFGIMTTWIASPMIMALKYTIPTKNPKLNFGLGTLMGTSGYLNQFRGYGGLHWGMVTFGDRLSNITLSGGYAYVDAGFNRTRPTPGIYPAVPNPDPQPWNPAATMFDYNIPSEKIGISSAPIIGIAGITKIGKKASLFFDSMILMGKNTSSSTNFVYKPNGDPAYSEVKEDGGEHIIAFFMPGVRFSKSEDKAFQFAAAGVISSRNGNLISFPIPMCSWFFKF